MHNAVMTPPESLAENKGAKQVKMVGIVITVPPLCNTSRGNIGISFSAPVIVNAGSLSLKHHRGRHS